MQFSTSVVSSLLVLALSNFSTTAAAPVANAANLDWVRNPKIPAKAQELVKCLQSKNIKQCLNLPKLAIVQRDDASPSTDEADTALVLSALAAIASNPEAVVEKRAVRASRPAGPKPAKPASGRGAKAASHGKSIGKTVGNTFLGTTIGAYVSCFQKGISFKKCVHPTHARRAVRGGSAKPAKTSPSKGGARAKSVGKSVGGTAFATVLGSTFACINRGEGLACFGIHKKGKHPKRSVTADHDKEVLKALVLKLSEEPTYSTLPLDARSISEDDILEEDVDELSTIQARDVDEDWEDEEEADVNSVN